MRSGDPGPLTEGATRRPALGLLRVSATLRSCEEEGTTDCDTLTGSSSTFQRLFRQVQDDWQAPPSHRQDTVQAPPESRGRGHHHFTTSPPPPRVAKHERVPSLLQCRASPYACDSLGLGFLVATMPSVARFWRSQPQCLLSQVPCSKAGRRYNELGRQMRRKRLPALCHARNQSMQFPLINVSHMLTDNCSDLLLSKRWLVIMTCNQFTQRCCS